jgi:hypothetical protein
MKAAVVAIAMSIALQGCEKWQPTASMIAPDHKTVALVEVSFAGAPAGNETRVAIKNGTGGTLPEPVYVVEANNSIVGHTRLRWLDADHLQVTLCEATAYRVRTENLRDPAYRDAGRGDGAGVPNAVWVEVENFAYSEQTKQCVPRGKSA